MKRYRLKAILIVILMGVLALTEIGCAMGESNLLDTLFKGNQPNEQAVKLVTPVGISKSQGDMCLTINEYMLDGYDLYIDWTAYSGADEMMLVTMAPVIHTDTNTSLGGNSVFEGPLMSRINFWTGIMLGDSYPQASAQRRLTRSANAVQRVSLLNQRLTESFDVTVTAFFLKPIAPVIINDGSGITVSKQPALLYDDDIIGAGITEFTSSCYFKEGEGSYDAMEIQQPFWERLQQLAPVASQDRIIQETWGEDLPKHIPMDEAISIYKDMVENMGYAKTVEQVNITFTVTPDEENTLRTELEGQSVFEYDDFTLAFTSVDFSAVHMSICYKPKLKPTEDNRIRLPEDEHIWLKVLIDGQEIQVMNSLSLRGRSYDKGEVTGLAPVHIPDELTIIPYRDYGSLDDLQTEEYAPLQLKVKKTFG